MVQFLGSLRELNGGDTGRKKQVEDELQSQGLPEMSDDRGKTKTPCNKELLRRQYVELDTLIEAHYKSEKEEPERRVRVVQTWKNKQMARVCTDYQD